MSVESVVQLDVQEKSLEVDGIIVENLLPGKWEVRSVMMDGHPTKIYLHNTVGLEAATKLFIWEDLAKKGKTSAKYSKNLEGNVIGIVTRTRV